MPASTFSVERTHTGFTFLAWVIISWSTDAPAVLISLFLGRLGTPCSSQLLCLSPLVRPLLAQDIDLPCPPELWQKSFLHASLPESTAQVLEATGRRRSGKEKALHGVEASGSGERGCSSLPSLSQLSSPLAPAEKVTAFPPLLGHTVRVSVKAHSPRFVLCSCVGKVPEGLSPL